MLFVKFFTLLSVFFAKSHGAVLIWSNKPLDVSPLQDFSDEDLSRLLDNFASPDLFVFENPSPRLQPLVKEVIESYYSAYNPNGRIDNSNATELLDDGELDVLKIRETVNNKENNGDFVAVIILPESRRLRRDTSLEEDDEQENTSTIESTTIEDRTPQPILSFREPDNSSVIYIGKTNDKLFAMLYSSKPLMLINGDTKILLGNTQEDMINVDSRQNRLNVIIAVDKGTKITLRFIFTKEIGYITLSSVRVSYHDERSFNLTAMQDITSPAGFSYHCSGETLFKGSNVSLYLYDLQVQFDASETMFGDAFDCIPFTTVPIWSGLFVTCILGLGLAIALAAIMNIKTMDKFDNQKTKNLPITVSE